MKLIIKSMLILLILFSSVYAQYREPLFKVHDRGELWETVKDNGQIGGLFSDFLYYPSLDWPGGPEILPTKDEQRSYMQGAGLWIGGKKENGSVFFNEMGPFSYADQGTFSDMIETENFIGSPDYNPYEAEEKIITQFTINNSNLEVKRISRSWSFPAYSDFIIFEYRFINRATENLSDVYFGFPYLIRPSYQDILVQGQWGDNLNVTDEIVGYDEARNLLYAYDSFPADYITSLGNYYEARNELRTPGYAGFAPLYSDEASDARPQPNTVLYAQTLNNTQLLTLASRSSESMYSVLNGDDATLQAIAGVPISPFMLLGFGPYNVNMGDSIVIVLAEAVNGLPLERVIDVESGDLESAQALLPAGLDSLKNTMDRAQLLFDNSYHPVSLPPPSPDVEYFVLPSTQEIAITWDRGLEDWIDPLTGEDDLQLYRIYRSDRSFIGPFKKKKDIRVDRKSDNDRYFDREINKWKYKDNTVQVGVGYYYVITSVDSTKHESGKTNRNESALVTARLAAENTLDVNVFPNPFRLVSGLPTAGEENSIVFTHLPATCTIKIYTVNGELVRTLEHDNPNRDEEVWDQLTDARQKTAAGIYLYTVDSDVGKAKGTILLIK